jgi:hypothetical protein
MSKHTEKHDIIDDYLGGMSKSALMAKYNYDFPGILEVLRGAGRCCEKPQRVTCGTCNRSWCGRCDPAPSALCHYCHGRGHTNAPLAKAEEV